MSSDFPDQSLEQLKNVMQNYDAFSCAAENLEWLEAEEYHENWRCRYSPTGIQLDYFKFPEDYAIRYHIADVYARAVLAVMAYYEEWDSRFWEIPQAERRHYLERGAYLYQNYAMVSELRLISREWDYLVNEINYFAGENEVPVSSRERYLNRFEKAEVIELGGCYAGDAIYWAIERNTLLVVNCGFWD